MHECGRRPEPTPRDYCGERVTGQALCYAEERMVSPVHYSSTVRSIPAPRIGRGRMGIQPGMRRSWSPVYLFGIPPVYLFGPEYPAPALHTVSPVSLHSHVRPVPAPIQPGWVVSALHSRPPVRLHSPVCPIPPPRTRPEVCVPSPVPPVPAARTRPPVRLQGPVRMYVIHVTLATLNYATLFTCPTLLISYVYTVLDTIYCILPMPFCTITHSYIFMFIFFIPLHLCV